jgi:hypothetical protein
MATKKTSDNGKQPNEIIIAPGTDIERKILLVIPRGKEHRANHLLVLSTFGALEAVATKMDTGQGGISEIVGVINQLFGMDNFHDLVAFVTGLTDEEGRNYLDQLLPLEEFMAYMEGASFFVNGGQSDAVQAALKK